MISRLLGGDGRRLSSDPRKIGHGIEIPNKETTPVLLRGSLESTEFTKVIVVVAALDVTRQSYSCDLAKMPHLLIAGATGSGKLAASTHS